MELCELPAARPPTCLQIVADSAGRSPNGGGMTGRAAGALTRRGRVGARSAPGWGELRSKRRKKIHPHPTAFAARKRSTSPLQGEVKRASGPRIVIACRSLLMQRHGAVVAASLREAARLRSLRELRRACAAHPRRAAGRRRANRIGATKRRKLSYVATAFSARKCATFSAARRMLAGDGSVSQTHLTSAPAAELLSREWTARREFQGAKSGEVSSRQSGRQHSCHGFQEAGDCGGPLAVTKNNPSGIGARS
jgi:hypothetical protein